MKGKLGWGGVEDWGLVLRRVRRVDAIRGTIVLDGVVLGRRSARGGDG